MEMSHEMLAKLIGGTYALTLGSYIFAWLGMNRIQDRIDKVRDNHVAHLEQRIAEIEKAMSARDETPRVTSDSRTF